MVSRTVLALALLAGLLGGSHPMPSAEVVLSLWLPTTNLDGLAKLSLRASWAGVGQGRTRQEGWRPIALLPGNSGKWIEFPTAQDQPVPVGRGRLPAGMYQRVFVAADELMGMATDGQDVRPANHVEPIALPVYLAPGTTAAVAIELTVERQSSRRGGNWQVFVKDACLRSHRDSGRSSAVSGGPRAELRARSVPLWPRSNGRHSS